MTAHLPPDSVAKEHFHTDGPLVQIGWLGHKDGCVYRLDEKPGLTEPGGWSPIYRHWGEECGHQIRAAEEGATGLEREAVALALLAVDPDDPEPALSFMGAYAAALPAALALRGELGDKSTASLGGDVPMGGDQ